MVIATSCLDSRKQMHTNNGRTGNNMEPGGEEGE